MEKQQTDDAATMARVPPPPTGSRVVCEECGARLNATHQDEPVMTAVCAKDAGVWVKNFAIHGDESGYHFFCAPPCSKAWADKHIHGNICCVRCGEPGGRFKSSGLCYACEFPENVEHTDEASRHEKRKETND